LEPEHDRDLLVDYIEQGYLSLERLNALRQAINGIVIVGCLYLFLDVAIGDRPPPFSSDYIVVPFICLPLWDLGMKAYIGGAAASIANWYMDPNCYCTTKTRQQKELSEEEKAALIEKYSHKIPRAPSGE